MEWSKEEYLLSGEYKQLVNEREEVVNTVNHLEDSELFIDKDSPILEYHRREHDPAKNTVHWGQLKLILSEIQLLTTYWSEDDVPNLKVVYAGSAPGHHITILSHMFPSIEWYLYDPRRFMIGETDKIRLYNEYFTDDIAREWSGRSDVVFISDIRSASFSSLQDMVLVEDAISVEMKMQKEWVLIMDPYLAMLKMRLPYVVVKGTKYTDYLAGDIMLQSFVGSSSSETRLIPTRDGNGRYHITEYDNKQYEDALFYHNSVVRTSKHYLDPVCDKYTVNSKSGLDDHFDSTHLIFVLNEYLLLYSESAGYSVSDDCHMRLRQCITLADEIMDKISESSANPVSLNILKKK